jgi:tetratricopeptide (TPR) repeat protein
MRLHLWFVIGMAVLGCGTPPAAPQRDQNAAPQDWQQRASALLAAGNCKGAIGYLNTIRERDPFWYELASQAHMACWRQNGSAAEAIAATSVIDQGLKAFPQSANLLLSRGYRHQELGHRQEALRDFVAAQAQARANLAQNSAVQKDADRAVLQSASQAASQLQDPAVGERIKEQEILKMIAAGNCEGAISRLQSEELSSRTDAWFDHVFVANSFCFNVRGDAAYRTAAEAALSDGLRRFPSSPRLLADCGAWNEAAGKKAEAIACYERALSSPDADSELTAGRHAVQEALERLRRPK